jgi:carboxylate-amine ligase
MPLDFTASAPLSMGVELELMVLNTHDYNLVRGAPDLLARLEKVELDGEVKPEITESMIEINSAVNTRYDELLAELVRMRDAIVIASGRLNVAVAGGGSHPFHKWNERRIFPTERFQRVSALYGYLAKQFTVFGQHIHIGVASGDDAIYLTHHLAPYIPHFIALSASSPFSQGEDTSFETSRLHAVSAFPLSGQMPPVKSWAEFNRYFDEMLGYGIVASMKDFYWDIRPKPEYGTIEIRVCDTPLTVRRAALLAAYAQCLSAYHLEARTLQPSRITYLVNSHNRFEACRYGFRGSVVDPYIGRKTGIGEDILDTLTKIAPHAARLRCGELLDELAAGVRIAESDAGWLRRRHAARGSLADVVRDACSRWEKGA